MEAELREQAEQITVLENEKRALERKLESAMKVSRARLDRCTCTRRPAAMEMFLCRLVGFI